MNYSNYPVTKEFRQKLRRENTPSEKRLWNYLKERQIEGYKFRQQHGYGPYVMDFYCPALRLCIELDGEVHNIDDVKEKDSDRTQFLNQNRITVLRFKNDEVEENIREVLNSIKACIRKIEEKKNVQTPNPLT